MTEQEEVEAKGWLIRRMKGDAAWAAIAGTEIHFRSVDTRRAIRRNALREFAQQLLDEFGMLTTRVEIDDEDNHRFVKHMGFTDTWADDTYRYYLMTALPFERA